MEENTNEIHEMDVITEIVKETPEEIIANKKEKIQSLKTEIETLQIEYNDCREQINQFRKAEDEENTIKKEEIGNGLLNRICALKEEKKALQEEIEQIEKKEENVQVIEEKTAEKTVKQEKVQLSISLVERLKKVWSTLKVKIIKVFKNVKMLNEAKNDK